MNSVAQDIVPLEAMPDRKPSRVQGTQGHIVVGKMSHVIFHGRYDLYVIWQISPFKALTYIFNVDVKIQNV